MNKSKPAIVVDAHLDFAYNAVVLGRNLETKITDLRAHERRYPPRDPRAGTATVSLPALLEGHVAVIGGSLYAAPWSKSHPEPVPTYRTPAEAHQLAAEQLDYYRRLNDEREDVRLLHNSTDLEEVLSSWETASPQVGIFTVMEGADPIQSPDELAWWVERGLRGVGLSWAAGTRYAGGNARPGDLTDEGLDLLDAMADFNLLLDLSHLWVDAAFRALNRYPGPVVATHANPQAFVNSPRMLSDDLILTLAERGGVIGIVAYNRMLDPEWRYGEPRLPLDRMAQAIDHVCQITGDASFVGIGSDLDGGFGLRSIPAELDSVTDLQTLIGVLAERGYSENDINNIMSGNWLRVMAEVLDAM
jgi:membrane dipeptidase